MSSKFSNKYPIPEKFPQILHDYAKEVVRCQPKDIIDFSFQYFFNLENRITSSFTPLATQRNTSLNSEQNIIQTESMPINTEQSEINVIIDSKDDKIINNDNSKNITQNYERNDEDENNSENNQLIEPEAVVPLSKDFEELIKNKEEKEKGKKIKEKEEEEKEKNEEKTPSMYSGISGNDPEKQGVKDFVSDLFF